MEQTRPLFRLLSLIEDDEQRKEALLLFQYLGISDIGQLTAYSRQQLLELEVRESTVATLEDVLGNKYGLALEADRDISVLSHPTCEVASSGFTIVDKGFSLEVNGVVVPLSGHARALKKQSVIAIFRLAGEGKDGKEIARQIGCNSVTVDNYLKRLKGISAYRSRQGSKQRKYTRASGSPPQREYADMKMLSDIILKGDIADVDV